MSIASPSIGNWLKSMNDIGDWHALKRELASQLPDLGAFSQPVDDLIRKRIIDGRASGELKPYQYDPLLFQRHGADVAQLLDRCLAYRKEARELEVSAVRNALDFALTINGLEAEERTSAIDHDTAPIRAEIAGLQAASQHFDQAPSAEAKGWSANVKATMAERQARIAPLASRQDTVLSKLGSQRRLEEFFQLRVKAPGTAHNYAERMNRTIGLLAEDLHEALLKYGAMLQGVEEVYGYKGDSSDVNAKEFQLDRLVAYVRRTLRELDARSQYESTFELVIPLFTPWLAGGDQIGDANKFQAAAKSGTPFVFDLSPVFAGIRRPRLQGIGVSLSIEREIHKLPRERFLALVQTPSHLENSEVAKLRPPIVLGNIQFLGLGDPTYYAGPGCDNALPAGKWEIQVKPPSESIESSLWDWIFGVPVGLNLHLKLAISDADQLKKLIETKRKIGSLELGDFRQPSMEG
jgi:hypothetical protein